MRPAQTPDICLTVATEQLRFIVAKARQFEVKDVPAVPGPGCEDGHLGRP